MKTIQTVETAKHYPQPEAIFNGRGMDCVERGLFVF